MSDAIIYIFLILSMAGLYTLFFWGVDQLAEKLLPFQGHQPDPLPSRQPDRLAGFLIADEYPPRPSASPIEQKTKA